MEQNQETGRQFNMGELREEKLLKYNLKLNVAGSTTKSILVERPNPWQFPAKETQSGGKPNLEV